MTPIFQNPRSAGEARRGRASLHRYYIMNKANQIAIQSGEHLPGISIVTPSFNQKRFLGECIDSILSQNYPRLEYIIMDGGSTDGSVEIIKKHEKYLTYWQSRKDEGQYPAITEGFRHSTHEIMTWLNSDDRLHRGALQIAGSVFSQRPDVDWIMGRPNGFDEHATKLWVFNELPLWSREKYLRKQYKDPYIQQEGTFWRRSLWDKAGGKLREDLQLAGDLELWVRFFRHAQLFTLDALLAGFRNHPEQKSGNRLGEYHREAEEVLDAEGLFYEKSADRTLLPAPRPLYIKPA